MCNRYTIIAKAEELADRFSIDVPNFYKPTYNAAPAQLLPVITSNSPEGLSTFYWGVDPVMSKNKVVAERFINFRSEQISEKSVYRKTLQSHRCIVIADGYYEWKKIGKKATTPYRIVLKDKSIFSFAGVWEEYEDMSGETHHTFAIFTVAANKAINSITDRMPAILTKETEKIWLKKSVDEAELVEALQVCPAEKIDVFTVSSRVNSIENNDRSLIIPAPAQDQFGNLTLFN